VDKGAGGDQVLGGRNIQGLPGVVGGAQRSDFAKG
jgi:hypothetical protein